MGMIGSSDILLSSKGQEVLLGGFVFEVKLF